MPARATTVLIATLLLGSACGGSDEAVEPDAALQPDAPADEPFGRACTNPGEECPDPDPTGVKLFCVGIQGAAGKGFCTRECVQAGPACTGVPNGQWAACVLQGTEVMYCAFACKAKEYFWDCPGSLGCGTPDGEGNAFCVPK
jgi:hypothetical protein